MIHMRAYESQLYQRDYTQKGVYGQSWKIVLEPCESKVTGSTVRYVD
jgi:hypothetical protein